MNTRSSGADPISSGSAPSGQQTRHRILTAGQYHLADRQQASRTTTWTGSRSPCHTTADRRMSCRPITRRTADRKASSRSRASNPSTIGSTYASPTTAPPAPRTGTALSLIGTGRGSTRPVSLVARRWWKRMPSCRGASG